MSLQIISVRPDFGDKHDGVSGFRVLVSRARQRMDRMTSWGPDYAAEHHAREQALAAASRHYFKLIDMGAEISPLLAGMVLSEGGLTP